MFSPAKSPGFLFDHGKDRPWFQYCVAVSVEWVIALLLIATFAFFYMMLQLKSNESEVEKNARAWPISRDAQQLAFRTGSAAPQCLRNVDF